MKKNIIFLFLLLSFFIILQAKNISLHMIEIREYSTKEVMFQQFINPGKPFALKYIHSVAQTPVWEFFEMTDEGKLMLTETHFYDHGAGLPYTAFDQESFIREDNKFKIKNMSREILLPLHYRIGEMSENVFIFSDQTIHLSQKLGDTVVTIDIIKMTLWKYLLNKIISIF